MTLVPAPLQYDVAIVGGGIVGSCVAYFLKASTPDAEVCVVEPEPSYAFASSSTASGACSTQLADDEAVDMALFGLDFIRRFGPTISTPTADVTSGWIEGGSLRIVPPASMKGLESAVERQRARGAEVEILSPVELAQRFPSIRIDGLGGGAWAPHDGWCDAEGLLWGVRRKAVSLGVAYLQDHVIGATVSATQVLGLRLAGGGTVRATAFVNAAGAWSGRIAKLMGMTLPVSPSTRYAHDFAAGAADERLPSVEDDARLAVRSSGDGFRVGRVDGAARPGFDFSIDEDYVEREVRPALAFRFPALATARCVRTWAGLSDLCEFDGRPVVGRWNDGLRNLYTVAGFSGRGLVQAPAAARAIAELVTFGEFRTIDLARLGYERIEANMPYRDDALR